MAWNEPGNGQKDPWNRQRASGRKTDIDGLIKSLKSRFGRLGNSGGIVTVVLAILLAWLLLSSYVIVGAREVGVVLRFGEFSRMLAPGFHLKLPRPFETVTRVQTTQVQSVSVNARMLTSDENIITVDFNVQFQVSDARKFLFSLGEPPPDTLRLAAEAAVRSVVGANDMDNILTSPGDLPAAAGTVAAPAAASAAAVIEPKTRETLQQQIRSALQKTLDSYNSGLVVNDISFQNVAPPAEVKDAFDDVNAAREDKQRSENEARTYANSVLPDARAQGARVAALAQGYLAERVARATGDTTQFNQLLKEYRAAPGVTRRRLYLETMEQVMANNAKVVDGSNGKNIINLPSERAPARSLTGVVQSAAGAVDTNPAQEAKP
ncbi:FtsH protease activity modulator HflK [Pinirhizobacter soli]|uniref:FtsH protease activity modulator HflK n=1 Tax=Pinirhizobacter soli TaxID=2786953 RepID=UPI00202A6EB0|nr:FtsH protease activity modulator HflK [Pinirhizobacter soli]